jgi:hypothetical protein
MTIDEFMRLSGGTNIHGDPAHDAPESIVWNFGVAPSVMGSSDDRDAAQSLYGRFPNLQGKWDGKTSINHHEAARKVLGTDLKAHQQPRGTCGGRAGARGLELLQLILIANGKRAKFSPVSHAWLYFLARRDYNMLRGGDGVPDGSIPVVMEKYGCLTRTEANDPEQAGPRSDDVAVKWGGGGLSADAVAKLTKEASDNVVTARVRVRSAQELADGIAAGGVAICSDAQGFTMTRDGDGFCSPSGTWYHYHVRSGIVVTPRGRKGFVYDQSWGDKTPSGPLVNGCPPNCFGVDWDVQDRLCRSGSVDVVMGFDLWDLESGKVNPWVF